MLNGVKKWLQYQDLLMLYHWMVSVMFLQHPMKQWQSNVHWLSANGWSGACTGSEAACGFGVILDALHDLEVCVFCHWLSEGVTHCKKGICILILKQVLNKGKYSNHWFHCICSWVHILNFSSNQVQMTVRMAWPPKATATVQIWIQCGFAAVIMPWPKSIIAIPPVQCICVWVWFISPIESFPIDKPLYQWAAAWVTYQPRLSSWTCFDI